MEKGTLKRTLVTTSIPYPVIWDQGKLDVRIGSNLYSVAFKRGYREGSNKVEIKFDRLGQISFTDVRILFPDHVEDMTALP